MVKSFSLITNEQITLPKSIQTIESNDPWRELRQAFFYHQKSFGSDFESMEKDVETKCERERVTR